MELDGINLPVFEKPEKIKCLNSKFRSFHFISCICQRDEVKYNDSARNSVKLGCFKYKKNHTSRSYTKVIKIVSRF